MIEGLDAATAGGAAYGTALLAVAYAVDALSRRAAHRSSAWRTGGFTYHQDHDAWTCPQDQWLWPHSVDPDSRVVRYRASPTVCGSCPVRSSCTTSPHGRSISRAIDPWPSSEAERFHRGIACLLATLAVLWPLAVAAGERGRGAGVLALVAAVLAAAGLPLWSHLRRTPAGFPEHLVATSSDEDHADGVALAGRQARRRARYASDRRPEDPR